MIFPWVGEVYPINIRLYHIGVPSLSLLINAPGNISDGRNKSTNLSVSQIFMINFYLQLVSPGICWDDFMWDFDVTWLDKKFLLKHIYLSVNEGFDNKSSEWKV